MTWHNYVVAHMEFQGIHSGKYLDGLTKEISIPDGI